MPGDITPLNLAKLLSMPPADVPECMLKKEGERIEPGDVLARTKGIFGKFRTEYTSQVAGTIESISAVTGQVIVRGAPLPVQVKAYLAGRSSRSFRSEGCVDRSGRHLRPGHLRHRRRDVRADPHGVPSGTIRN